MKLAISLISSALLLSPLANADQHEHHKKGKRLSIEQRFDKIDTNKDKSISFEEFKAAMDKRLERMKDKREMKPHQRPE